ncbi:aldo/keto reductase [Winogradskyella arenosi]|uniref:Aryl-alcohol dehydrogenase-like predicted oxidoreductase n=1 Tax=Winogradskyella arenosi TaxID=533325 RepID=A0A368ZH64_9FLAO|nr:aldo/keto reductase [Winogradskyella arenosi]RCW92831.1 aryl-alcohol dehydrogenase-like predicted oxidoreductase [Winogradskyella arenosi]
MKYNSYIKDTAKVSEIGLGAWQLGQNSGWKSMSEKDAIHLVETAIDYGVNFFDTAPNYGHGSGEERLGKALKIIDRSKVVINTKFGHTHKGITNYKASYIRESLEGSLKRLQVDYVDSLIIHNPPSSYLDGYKNDHYGLLETLIEEGKIKAYGASVDTYKDMKLLISTTNAKVIEAFFNILHQDTARGFDLAKEKDVAIIAKIPLDSGWLSGKYNKNSNFKGIRSRWSKKDIETRAQLIEKIKTIIGEDTHLAQKALSFCLSYDAVSTVIPGNANCNQLKTNVESVNYPLSKNTINELEQFYHTEVKPLNLPW